MSTRDRTRPSPRKIDFSIIVPDTSSSDYSIHTPSNSPSSDVLPIPDLSILTHSSQKKSHARKQPHGHIPRPRNAFILFRSALVLQEKIPDKAQSNHCAISCFAGDLWKRLTDEQRAPWSKLADQEKETHKIKYPNYRYAPGLGNSDIQGQALEKRKRTLGNEQRSASRGTPRTYFPISPTPSSSTSYPIFLPVTPTSNLPHRRASSCPPPGAEPVPQPAPMAYYQDIVPRALPTETRDDGARRPSCTIMYHSLPQTQDAAAIKQSSYTFPSASAEVYHPNTGAYRMASPGDAPGWNCMVPNPSPYIDSSFDFSPTMFDVRTFLLASCDLLTDKSLCPTRTARTYMLSRSNPTKIGFLNHSRIPLPIHSPTIPSVDRNISSNPRRASRRPMSVPLI